MRKHVTLGTNSNNSNSFHWKALLLLGTVSSSVTIQNFHHLRYEHYKDNVYSVQAVFTNTYFVLGRGWECVCRAELSLLVGSYDQHPVISLLQKLLDDHHVLLLAHHFGPLVCFLHTETSVHEAEQIV